ncbi:MAG: aminotransferase class IV [Paludibacter sp.]
MRLELHQVRLEKAMNVYYPNIKKIGLKDTLDTISYPTKGLYKCRIIFDSVIRKIEFIPYIRREINSLKLVETKIESRTYKLEDRSEFELAFSQRTNCDDVLLVKNGLLTDTSYCNIALYDGENWYTPVKPLLYGVNREQLIKENQLIEKEIKLEELVNFQQICLFNAMLEFGELIFDVSSIYP